MPSRSFQQGHCASHCGFSSENIILYSKAVKTRDGVCNVTPPRKPDSVVLWASRLPGPSREESFLSSPGKRVNYCWPQFPVPLLSVLWIKMASVTSQEGLLSHTLTNPGPDAGRLVLCLEAGTVANAVLSSLQ